MSKLLDAMELSHENFPELSLRDIFYIIFRQKWKILLIFLVVTGTVAFFAMSRQDIYRSEAKLMVQLGRENMTLDPTATTGQLINVSKSLIQEIKSELEILKSNDLAESVVDTMGIETILAGSCEESDFNRQNAVTKVQNCLKVKALDDSAVIQVAYEAHRPELAQDVLVRFLDLFLEKHIAVHQVSGSYDFFNEQTEYLRTNLTGIEDQVRSLKNKTGISSPDEYRSMHLQRIMMIENEIEKAEADLAFSSGRVRTLKIMLDKMPETSIQRETIGHQNSLAEKLRERLYDLQLKERELASTFDKENRMVQITRDQIAEVQALLSEEEPTHSLVTSGPNSSYQNLKLEALTELANADALREKINVLKSSLDEAQLFLQTLNSDEVKIRRLLRELSINEENYRRYSENLEQVRIDHALKSEKISNISIIQPANLPILPVGTSKQLVVALGFVLGIGCAACTALFSTYIDHSIVTPEQVKDKLDLPTLASIPRVHSPVISPQNQRAENSRKTRSTNAMSEIHWAIPNGLVEEYTTLYQRVRQKLLSLQGDSQVIAIASCSRQEGVSTVAANLAGVLSQQNDGRILLIDTNMAHPTVHNILKTERSPGLTDVCVDNKIRRHTIQPTRLKNLHVLTAGMPKPNLPNSVHLDQFSRLLDVARERYQFVVVDIPSLGDAKPAMSLCNLCDSVVLVVESERLRWEVIKNHKDRLTESEANILGVVLNKRRYPIPDFVYRSL